LNASLAFLLGLKEKKIVVKHEFGLHSVFLAPAFVNIEPYSSWHKEVKSLYACHIVCVQVERVNHGWVVGCLLLKDLQSALKLEGNIFLQQGN
jgi:hypothetical protein